jgi:superfamily I DNA and/or RNA helicase
MHESIMAFSNDHFYENKLTAHESVAQWHVDDRVVEFIDTAGCGYEEGVGEVSRSRFNDGELNLIKNHLKTIPDGNEIAVISPYREQVGRLQKELVAIKNVKCETVDSFQGQERDVVYISLVRSNDKGEIGFLKDYRRMNVAMTRAKKKLVIVGDSATIGQDKFFGALIDYFEKQGFYRSAWELIEY